jgi:EAL domain-containing protein (putative c-di-GMP-specific phosphodiesterase class I)
MVPTLPVIVATDPTPDAPPPAVVGMAVPPAPAPRPATSDYAGYRLASHFQPIYSLTHHRAVGHEALLRATSLATGAPVPPMALFASVDGDRARVGLDRAALMQHLAAYVGKDANEWLFLNVHPRSLASAAGPGIREIADALALHGMRPEQVVIEVLESTLPDDEDFDRRIDELRELGCLVSLDDFGAGHSNFDRVFRLRPEIVKLDRSVVARAEVDAHARRIASQMVSLLHECGCLVLMEGIETDEGAYTALRCDVDFVQGYHFGRPAPSLAAGAGLHALRAAWDRFDRQSVTDDRLWQEQMSPYKQSIELASVLLAGGASMDEACRRFLVQAGAAMCYLLDKQGRQVVGNAFRDGLSHHQLESEERFAPLHDTRAARWSRRSYFRGAEASPNIAQVTRPYMTLQGSRMCFTVSIQFDMGGRMLVLCGDASL